MNSKQIVYLSQSQYAELIANGTITVNGVTVTYDENDIYVTPQAEPVTDVRVAGTSISSNGIANIPLASQSSLGVVKQAGTGYSVSIQNDGALKVVGADTATIKGGSSNSSRPIIPSTTHVATFYGLTRAAGVDMASSSNEVGTYTPEAKGAIQQMLGVSDLIATSENNLVASKAYKVGDVFTANGKLYKTTAAIAADAAIITDGANANCEETSIGEGFPHDVQINGESIVNEGVANIPFANANNGGGIFRFRTGRGLIMSQDGYMATNVTDVQINGTTIIDGNSGVANIPIATQTNFGVTKGYGSSGINIDASGNVSLAVADTAKVKAGTSNGSAIPPSMQHAAAFYGLAKASGDTTQSSSSNAVGVYTDNAKASIKSMLGIQDGSTGTVNVSGTAPTIAAVENTRYVCGEVTSLSFTPPSSGISIVRFTSGSTVTVLTIPNTVKFPEWFDPTALETNTIYEICVTDGTFGAVMSWAL